MHLAFEVKQLRVEQDIGAVCGRDRGLRGCVPGSLKEFASGLGVGLAIDQTRRPWCESALKPLVVECIIFGLEGRTTMAPSCRITYWLALPSAQSSAKI